MGQLWIKAEEWKKTQLVDWAQDEFMTKPGVYVVNYEAVKAKGKEIGLTPEDIDDVVDTLQKVLASRRTATLEFGQRIQITKTQKVSGRDVDAGPEDTKTSTRTIQEGEEGYVYDGGPTSDYYQQVMKAPGEIVLNDGMFVVSLDDFEPGTVVPHQAGEYHSRKVSSTQGGVNMDAVAQVPVPTPAEIEELNGITQQLAQEGDRKASEGADAISIDMLRELVTDQVKVAASTGYTDVNATARAAFLMGQETKSFWKKALASLKKEYLPEMKIGVQKMTKWGTIKPSLGAVRDVVIKVLQSHDVYPYPELVQGVMENAFAERLLGPETHWPLSEPR